jgi:hypothetical protein
MVERLFYAGSWGTKRKNNGFDSRPAGNECLLPTVLFEECMQLRATSLGDLDLLVHVGVMRRRAPQQALVVQGEDAHRLFRRRIGTPHLR